VSKSKKKSCITELEQIYSDSRSIIVTHYHGLTVEDVTKLRRSLREKGAAFKVVKNTLANLAANNSNTKHDKDMYAGPTAIAYSKDEIAAAKCVVEFAKTNDKLKIIGGLVNQSVVNVQMINQLANLPSMDQLRGKLIGLIQAPASKLARVIQTPAGTLARVFKAYADK
jgi:large subunit ribosomal protein L10